MTAHLLTALRLLLTVPVTAGLALPGLMAPPLVLAMILAAIATDWFDGIVARRTGTESAAGQAFDHTTDFLFVTAALSGAAFAGAVPAVLPVLIVAAFVQYVLDSRLLYREKRLRMSFIGRWNGILYFVPPVLLALSRLDAAASVVWLLDPAVWGFGYFLTLTTVISITDRALAPLRKAP